MIPETWTPVRRTDDDELVGYLEKAPTGTIPRLLTGAALGDSRTADAAAADLEAAGLAELDRVFWVRLPDPLPEGRTPASSPGRDWHWREVRIVSVTDSECVVRLRADDAEPPLALAVLPVPVAGLLRREAPGPEHA
jgi:hypothetical protein